MLNIVNSVPKAYCWQILGDLSKVRGSGECNSSIISIIISIMIFISTLKYSRATIVPMCLRSVSIVQLHFLLQNN